ncbi:MAG TPA: response regulator [Dongiaceae bacterium]|nr:response regulator [Dongiaceae bacterium]
MPEPGAAGREEPRILIVEDDFFVALDLEAGLTDAGMKVIGPARTAEEAVALARAEKPLLAVMDIRLASARDGIDAALDLYRDLGIRSIFASAHADASFRKRAEPASPLGWLQKPYTVDAVVSTVRRAITTLDPTH